MIHVCIGIVVPIRDDEIHFTEHDFEQIQFGSSYVSTEKVQNMGKRESDLPL